MSCNRNFKIYVLILVIGTFSILKPFLKQCNSRMYLHVFLCVSELADGASGPLHGCYDYIWAWICFCVFLKPLLKVFSPTVHGGLLGVAFCLTYLSICFSVRL